MGEPGFVMEVQLSRQVWGEGVGCSVCWHQELLAMTAMLQSQSKMPVYLPSATLESLLVFVGLEVLQLAEGQKYLATFRGCRPLIQNCRLNVPDLWLYWVELL